MLAVEKRKKPLIMAWIGKDEPLRGDSQMAVGLGRLCAEMTDGQYVYVDKKMLDNNFPKARDYLEQQQLLIKKMGTPDILIGACEASSVYYDVCDKQPIVTMAHIGETVSHRYGGNGLVPHNLNDELLATEKAKFKAHYPNIKGPLVAVMVAGQHTLDSQLIRDLQAMAKNYDEITFFFCPNRRSKALTPLLVRQMRYGLSSVFQENTFKDYVQNLFSRNKPNVLTVNYNAAVRGYNPYVGLLANADHIVVSGHSYSMVSDALYMEKTVHINWNDDKFAALVERGHLRLTHDFNKLDQFPTKAMPRVDVTRKVAELMVEKYNLGTPVAL